MDKTWRLVEMHWLSARLGVVALVAVAVASCGANNSQQEVQQAPKWEPAPLSAQDSAWLDSVNLQLYHCTREMEEGRLVGFHLVGEIHIYNEASSRFADTLLARMQPGMFLSEGADPDSPKSEFMQRFSSIMRAFSKGTDYDAPELSRLAKARAIPTFFLEREDSSTGTYEGITEAEQRDLDLIPTNLKTGNKSFNNKIIRMMTKLNRMPDDELASIFSKLTEWAGVDTTDLFKDELSSGIVDTRNEIMSSRAVKYVHPDSGCVLIRFGMAHADGMIEELNGYGCECESESLGDFLRFSQ